MTAETEDVRYHRARLTVARAGPLDGDDRLGQALDSYENGDVRPGTVAMAYLRARVVDHSPSFRWRGARLGELIPLVTSVSASPKIEAETSRELADALVELRRETKPKPPRTAAPAAPPAPRSAKPAEPKRAPPKPASKPTEPPRPPPEPKPTRRPASPQVRRRRIALVAGGLVAFVAIVLAIGHFGGAGERYADDYREQAGPAVKGVADSMDTVYDNFDLFLSGYETAIAREAIDGARETIEAQRALIVDAPDAPSVGGGEAVEEVDDAVASGDAYLADATKFLDELSAFIELDSAEVDERARGVYEQTIELAEEAEALEDAVFSLGTGEGDPDGPDHYRPATPSSLGDG